MVPGVLFLLGASLLTAQADGPRLKFDVAAVKRSSGDGPPSVRSTPDRLTMTNATLKSIVQSAFDLPGYRVAGWPGWLYDKFDIEARGPEGRTFSREQINQMLQALLVERFGLRFHFEPREMNVFRLAVGKSGVKMRDYREAGPGLPEFRTPDGANGQGIHGHPARPTRLVGQGGAMPMLADMLTRIMGQTVVDATGLTGQYDFDFEWAPESTYQMPAGGEPSDKPSIFAAIQQLGLRLEAGKGPVNVFVIDGMEKPTEN